MRVRIAPLLAAISLVMCLSAALLWVRTCRARDTLVWQWVRPRPDGSWMRRGAAFSSQQGVVELSIGNRLYRSNSWLLPDMKRFIASHRLDWNRGTRYWTTGRKATDRARVMRNGQVPAQPLGFHFFHQWSGYEDLPWSARGVDIPCWFLVLAFAILPMRWSWQWWASYRLRRAQARRSFCAHCGYDLTGNVSGVCPECGSAAPALPPVDVCSS